ncbi:MAG: hypothetical protein PHW96_04980, partial [Candidatus Nanoarchaeia archaeon]|nr:hypothetical protein [Candidatus Nanoarchaeia archaeon]
ITKNIGLYVVTEQRKKMIEGKEVLGNPRVYARNDKNKRLYDLIEDTIGIVCNDIENEELNSIEKELYSLLKEGTYDISSFMKTVKKLIKSAEDLLNNL